MIKFDRKKDKVAIIAPSSAIKDAENNFDLETSKKGLELAISLFKEHGLECVYDEKIFAGGSLAYFAATREERFRQFKDALQDPLIKIISIFRGGYGAGEIVFDLMSIKPSTPKIFIGFSDATAIHYLFNQHYKLPSIHGAVGKHNKDMISHMISVLEGHKVSLTLNPMNQRAQQEKIINAVTTGGNLTLICNMIGTKLAPLNEGKIVIIEEVNEAGYRVHRNLLHMKNAGLFDGAKAVVFGDFTASDSHLEASIEHFSDHYLKHLPVYRTAGVGHNSINYPFALGANAIINSNILEIESPFSLK